MSGFKSGVVHDPIAITEKDTAMAMLDSIKANSGLFKADLEGGYVAPHFCDYVPTGDLMMVKDASGKNVMVKSYIVESRNMAGKDAMKIRHLMGRCKSCDTVKMTQVIVNV